MRGRGRDLRRPLRPRVRRRRGAARPRHRARRARAARHGRQPLVSGRVPRGDADRRRARSRSTRCTGPTTTPTSSRTAARGSRSSTRCARRRCVRRGSLLVDELEPSDELPPVDTLRDDVAFWLYSSGSTGRPKGVVHLHRDLLYTCETYARHVLGITRADVTLLDDEALPCVRPRQQPLLPLLGRRDHGPAERSSDPDAIFAAVERFRPTLFFSVPTLYNAMLAAEDDGDFSSARLCVSAAEPLPADVWHRWHDKHGLVILDGIGSTEMLHIYCSNTVDDVAPGSSGRPVPGYDVKLVDDDGEVVDGPGSGDLYVRGDSMLREYWNQPEKTADSIRDGWFYSRDRYRRDEEGRYWCEGRADDMFKVSGLWVSPTDVEARLIEHPAVLEAAVVGVPVEGFTKGKAYVTMRDPESGGPRARRRVARVLRRRAPSLPGSPADRVRRQPSEDGHREDRALQAARVRHDVYEHGTRHSASAEPRGADRGARSCRGGARPCRVPADRQQGNRAHDAPGHHRCRRSLEGPGRLLLQDEGEPPARGDPLGARTGRGTDDRRGRLGGGSGGEGSRHGRRDLRRPPPQSRFLPRVHGPYRRGRAQRALQRAQRDVPIDHERRLCRPHQVG